MNKLPVQKTHILILILALIAASIACNIPEVIDETVERIVEANTESCAIVDRSEYKLAAAEIGQIPETPKYPENAWYQVCYINTEISSARMIDGDDPENDDGVEGEEYFPPPASEDEGEQIPVGTYVGTSNYPELMADWNNPGQYTKNEVDVRVTKDGTVSGFYLVRYVGDEFTTTWNNEECTGHWEVDYIGVFFGQLTDSQGQIESEENWVCTSHSNCDLPDGCSTEEPFNRKFDIKISGSYMTGTALPHSLDTEIDLDWTFNAVKQ